LIGRNRQTILSVLISTLLGIGAGVASGPILGHVCLPCPACPVVGPCVECAICPPVVQPAPAEPSPAVVE
jgi:hypothetical protein